MLVDAIVERSYSLKPQIAVIAGIAVIMIILSADAECVSELLDIADNISIEIYVVSDQTVYLKLRTVFGVFVGCMVVAVIDTV